MTSDDMVISWSIRLSILFYLFSLLLRIVSFPKIDGLKYASLASLIGFSFSLLHFWSAFEYHHHWSHQAAFDETAKRTADLFGFSIGYGIYFNYFFLAAWGTDLLVRCFTSAKRQWQRILLWSLQVYLLFIVVNGAIVFAKGPVQWLTGSALILLAILSLTKTDRSKQSSSLEGE